MSAAVTQHFGEALSESPPEELLPNPYPGETILEDFLKPWGKTPHWLARQMGVPPTRIDQVLKGRRSITADTAIRLHRVLGCSPEFWLGLQNAYDLREAFRGHHEDYASLQRYEHEGPLILD